MSEQLRTYPSPNPALALAQAVDCCWLGEGHSCSDTDVDPFFWILLLENFGNI